MILRDIDFFLNLLIQKEPFALTRFNDGEARAIFRPGDVVARGKQKVTQELSDAVRAAAEHVQHNYFVGIPCSKCYPKWHKKMLEVVKTEQLTYATVTTNHNLPKMYNVLPRIISDKNIIWMSGRDQNMTNLKTNTNISVKTHFMLPSKNAWREYDRIMRGAVHKLIPPDSVVMLSCGPMAEVLIHKWYQLRPDCTFIDVGSAYDPYTRNVYYLCHRGKAKPCDICNVSEKYS